MSGGVPLKVTYMVTPKVPRFGHCIDEEMFEQLVGLM